MITVSAANITVMEELIAKHLAHIRAGGFSPNTIEDREKLLRRIDRDLPMGIEEATVEELAGWLANPRWTRRTKAVYFGHIRGFFGWACDPRNPYLDWDPSASLIRPRVPGGAPKPVTDEELATCLDQLEQPWRRFVLLAAYAGMRCCEIAEIGRRNITRQNIRIKGKGDKVRLVPTAEIVWAEVCGLSGPIAPDDDAASLSRRSRHRFARIGLPDVTMHRFRHWFGTNLVGRGVGLRTVQELMGHASPATTALYTLVTDEQRQMAIAALPAPAPVSR